VWNFDVEGIRRTQNLGGGVMARAPFHWVGDLDNLPNLMEAVFAVRMSGGEPTETQKKSLGPWLDRIKAPSPTSNLAQDAVARGQALFSSHDVGCATCHNGEQMTNLTIQDVGTGGKFKVPSLVGVAGRPPYMHDGCAATLKDRFVTCGNSDLHGHTSQLTPAQIDDLTAYLSSL
jgi:mono/diheme cytochrome c family protein